MQDFSFWIFIIFYAIAGYLIGGIPFGYLLVKLTSTKEDIRKTGSGNIGAANVQRTAGIAKGLLTVLLDVLKAAIPLFILRYYFLEDSVSDGVILSIIAFSIIIGHVYPVYLKFKGGKGVATYIGTMFVLFPLQTCIFLGLYIILLSITRYYSLSSMIDVALFPVILLSFNSFNLDIRLLPYFILSIALALLIIYKHKKNIIGLIHGQENRFSFKKKE